MNGLGHEGAVLKGLVNTNGEPKDTTDMVESGCGELDNVGVVVRVDQPLSEAEGSRLVPLSLADQVVRLRENLSGCNARCSPTGRDKSDSLPQD